MSIICNCRRPIPAFLVIDAECVYCGAVVRLRLCFRCARFSHEHKQCGQVSG
jgi:hypothetical protein